MGVHGLWELLSPVGHRVSNEHVRHKVLAVDVSIWLTQFIKAMRDAEGAQVRNAHLLGVLRRCIKLLYLSVRPVLVFDGATPALKRRTLASRRAMRERQEAKLRRLAEKLLVNQMKQSAVKEAMGGERGGKGRRRGETGGREEGRLEEEAERGEVCSGQTEDDAGTGIERNVEEADEDRIKLGRAPPRVLPTLAGSGETSANAEQRLAQEADNAIFAADLADEEDALTRDRTAEEDPMALPYDLDELDDDALVRLPAPMQSEVFKQIKQQQRVRHRERMMERRSDPAAFSRSQIEGFMEYTALNKKIKHARNAINSKTGASQRIASDSQRQFVLREKDGKGGRGDEEGSSDSDDDLISSAGRSQGTGRGGSGRPDILAQLRAQRDELRGAEEAQKEKALEQRREEQEERSGVGWASRVLEGRGGLALGGRSILKPVSKSVPSSSESSDLSEVPSVKSEAEVVPVENSKDENNPQSHDQENSDDDDDIEWEDGDDSKPMDFIPDDDPFDSLLLSVPQTLGRVEVAKAKLAFDKERVRNGKMSGPQERENETPGDPTPPVSTRVIGEKDDSMRSILEDGASPKRPETNLFKQFKLPMRNSSKENAELGLASKVVPKQGDIQSDRAPQVISKSDSDEAILINNSDESGLRSVAIQKRVRFAGDGNAKPPGTLEDERSERREQDFTTADVDASAVSNKDDLIKALDSQKLKAIHHMSNRGEETLSSSLEIASKKVANDEAVGEEVGMSGSAVDVDKVSDRHGVVVDPRDSIPEDVGKQHRKTQGDIEEEHDMQEALALSLEDADSGNAVTKSPSFPRKETVTQGPSSAVPLAVSMTVENREAIEGDMAVEEVAGPAAVQGIEKSADEADDVGEVEGRQAQNLREATEMSHEQMQELRDELELEAQVMNKQHAVQRGQAESVSDEMYAETRDLLKLLGIPYLEAPTEAEAQCAFLNEQKVVDGVITEDSDAFLFGAKTVYRRLFADGRFAEAYVDDDIQSQLGLDRERLISLALLLGSDYTAGVRGVGVVNSMEILEAFPGASGLHEFRDWTSQVTLLDAVPDEDTLAGTTPQAVRTRFCYKHRNMKRNWEIRAEFPSAAVVEAYRHPSIDARKERFSWRAVDFQGLARFCWEKFGWEPDRFEQVVGPLRKRLDTGNQRRIDEFFRPHRFAKIRSQRLQTAVRGIAGEDAKGIMAEGLGGGFKRLAPQLDGEGKEAGAQRKERRSGTQVSRAKGREEANTEPSGANEEEENAEREMVEALERVEKEREEREKSETAARNCGRRGKRPQVTVKRRSFSVKRGRKR